MRVSVRVCTCVYMCACMRVCTLNKHMVYLNVSKDHGRFTEMVPMGRVLGGGQETTFTEPSTLCFHSEG